MSKLRVGFIGLGIMGRAMARNIVQAGFPVTVWNRTRSKMEEATAWGAKLADSPKQVAEQSDVVITVVGDTPDVKAVLTGEQGVFQGARNGVVVIDMSTIAAEAERELASQAKTLGIDYLDAPVSGGDIGAQNGTLSIMVGGEAKALEKVRPILEAMGQRIVHCGEVGAGQTVKACNQILCGLNLLAVVEALSYAKKAGVDVEKMIEVTTQGAGGSWALANYAPRIIQGDLEPGFSVEFIQKDLRIVLQEAEQMQLPLMGTALVQQLLRSLQAHGGNPDGSHALIQVMEQLGNVEIVPNK
ncbi:3-hydroxyisobutyrate dehydrogenase [Thermoactinomyces sp. DSM 45891]|uniref:NAD(P)-dependent oxidoreductase n=1 Tax=Thermoactinomyces sp. DSM 45891 TaxID=1761907 RepID=UPI000917068C|nr:NAD(P)-dependent oxidoreductase [Thermoactinomyces sp. DSM 45891]SFX71232.1 3-hydroxyisobutyrate dehydrogenase [Thermoactinomyces sp. DSM 45891]